MTTTHYAVEELPWDSTVLKRHCGRIIARLPEITNVFGDDPAVMDDIQRRFEMLDAKVPAAAESYLLELGDAGFRVVGVVARLVTDGQELVDRVPPRKEIEVVPAALRDADEMAGAFTHTRIHNDEHIIRHLADDFYLRWCTNAVAQRTDERSPRISPSRTTIAITQGIRPAGFLATQTGHDGVHRIELVAVPQVQQQTGVASTLIRESVSYYLGLQGPQCKDPLPVEVGCELTSPGALALYTSMGFQLRETTYSLHWHRRS